METEAFFLNVVYYSQQLEPKIDSNGKEIYKTKLIVKRCCLHEKNKGRDDYKFKRLNVDFDPLGKQIGFLVIILNKTEDIYKTIDGFTFSQIFLEEDEAKKAVEEIQRGGYRGFLQKKEKYSSVYYLPISISEN